MGLRAAAGEGGADGLHLGVGALGGSDGEDDEDEDDEDDEGPDHAPVPF